MKNYTSIEQSKKLLELGLSSESADMFYSPCVGGYSEYPGLDLLGEIEETCLPCWSVGALLGILPNYQLQTQDDGIGILCDYKGIFNIVTADNPLDAAFEMICWLLENGYIKKGE